MAREALLAIAMSAAQRGGEILREYFGELKPAEIAEKTRNDWVSAADRASEEAIRAYLTDRTPEYGVLAEEGGASGATGTRWVVDPLDGTLNFVRGFPHFAVSVALVSDGTPEIGAIYDPMRDQLFAAISGGGAFCNGTRLHVSDRPGLAGALVTTGFPFRVHRHLDVYLRIFREVFLRVAGLRRPGAAALDLAHTAAGIFDGFFEFCLSPWDIAAGALIVGEAGGLVTNLDGGPDILSRGNVLAATPGVHRGLLVIISSICRERDIVP
ncbi:MAG: inositol monophosphatase family protein [Acidobacteriota bacterium]